jgi:hypothetical protein
MMDLRRWIVALLLLCTAVLHAQSVSLADLARHDQYRDVKISPDGKYLAATAIVKGQTVLALIRLADKKGNVISPREGNDVIDFWWASPTRVLYTVGEHQGGYDSPLATGELFGVDGDGGNPKLLYGYRSDSMSTGTHIQHATADRGVGEFIASIPDDPNHVLVAISTWDAAGKEGFLPIAYRMDVRDGNLARIVTAPMRNVRFVADHQGRIRFAYGEDVNGNVKVYSHPLNGEGWELMSKPGDDRAYPWSFSRDDSMVYFSCGAVGGFGICSWDPSKNTWTTIWSNPKVMPDGFVYGMTDDDVIGISFMDGRPGLSFFQQRVSRREYPGRADETATRRKCPVRFRYPRRQP